MSLLQFNIEGEPRWSRAVLLRQAYGESLFGSIPTPSASGVVICMWYNDCMPINWNTRRYSQEEFIAAWIASYSIAEVARKLNLTLYGSTYETLKSTAKELKLNTDHMSGQGHLKGKKNIYVPKRPLNEVLVVGKKEQGSRLLLRLIEELEWKWECNKCRLTEWNGSNIPLELDHINGNNHDNRIENLRALCPNCHAQTDTYCGKNIKKQA